ncbi:hypothetical protein [Legionella pneumophila]|uniref:hypothetical protein n=1 Tax=Legionella pneumophila TaxID=446 RepID=UPI001EDFF6F6|nr:hypothetical protein [Legionella pneumophila]
MIESIKSSDALVDGKSVLVIALYASGSIFAHFTKSSLINASCGAFSAQGLCF